MKVATYLLGDAYAQAQLSIRNEKHCNRTNPKYIAKDWPRSTVIANNLLMKKTGVA